MTVARGLLRILWRQAMPATFLGGVVMGAYAMFWPDVMTARDHWPVLIVLGYGLLLAMRLGQFGSPAFAFAHSRGYSRDALWGHVMLTSAFSVMAAWLPAAVIVWTGLRSLVHDRLFQSPYFPIMAPREYWIPVAWLGGLVLWTTACHYAWIRRAQPTHGGRGGWLAASAMVAALFVALNMVRYLHGWFGWLCGALYVIVTASLIAGGRTLYRSVEVRA